MDISTQDTAQASTAAETMARTIDSKAECRDARWWVTCPLPHNDDGGEKWITIWQGMDGPVIRCLCGCATDKVRAWVTARQPQYHEQQKTNVIRVPLGVVD